MIKDTEAGYGAVSILFHWLGALAIIAIWLLGDRIDDFARASAERSAAQGLHFAVAFSCLIILVPRLVWRFLHLKTPLAETNSPFLDFTAKIVKWGLLAAMTILVISGPIDVWTSRRGAIDVFGWVISSPIPTSLNGVLHAVAGPAHVICAKAILILVALHVLGALKHLVYDRDGVFRRMLVPAK
ncbi:MAG: cytochrome b/b6 domain-containing protein [Ancalomicrobiaceae bacterium]|nr:cytochrome b/b6 domain-containing protein [Ancalomicrobiaceae bacterium]